MSQGDPSGLKGQKPSTGNKQSENTEWPPTPYPAKDVIDVITFNRASSNIDRAGTIADFFVEFFTDDKSKPVSTGLNKAREEINREFPDAMQEVVKQAPDVAEKIIDGVSKLPNAMWDTMLKNTSKDYKNGGRGW
ncbi:hypothetical protein LJB93_03550 [Desulfovibrio sp. OttesenSCG-928-F07]|nr:hypothetical protein [Desulfovibrio sp. OttesenSCG-928-F07]